MQSTISCRSSIKNVSQRKSIGFTIWHCFTLDGGFGFGTSSVSDTQDAFLLGNKCFRSSIATDLRKKKKLTTAEKQKITDGQNRLQSKIEHFNERLYAILGDFEWDDGNQSYLQEEPVSGEDVDDFEDEDAELDMDNEPFTQARISMPSTFGRDFCFKNGWEKIMDQEMLIRIAQAEESLDELRLAIGHKSLLYKIHIRKSKTQASKTRSQAELVQVNSKIKECASTYRRARAAMLSLGASAETLSRFKILQDADLKVNTDVVEENRFGQRNETLPWIWRIGGGGGVENPWMDE